LDRTVEKKKVLLKCNTKTGLAVKMTLIFH